MTEEKITLKQLVESKEENKLYENDMIADIKTETLWILHKCSEFCPKECSEPKVSCAYCGGETVMCGCCSGLGDDNYPELNRGLDREDRLVICPNCVELRGPADGICSFVKCKYGDRYKTDMKFEQKLIFDENFNEERAYHVPDIEHLYDLVLVKYYSKFCEKSSSEVSENDSEP